jgi:N-acetylglucosamine kinase-like BadF-type ATPase
MPGDCKREGEAVRRTLLAIDVGGSTSRAVLVDDAGRCLGQGRSRGGNPASNSPDEAASSIISSVEAALADGGGPRDIAVALIALAGPQVHVALARLEAAFRQCGLSGPIVFAGDLLAMFASVTPAPDGYCIVAGTGAGAVRIRGGAIERVADAAGWLLGDLGSGYWLGHEAARAVAAELDGRGERTALTPALLDALGIRPSEAEVQGRPEPLRRFIDAVYALRPIELARFAPLVVAQRGDAVAARLIAEAERHLVADFATVFDPRLPGPVALGGGVIAHLGGVRTGVAAIVAAAGLAGDVRLVGDGSVGAAVLALRAVGVPVDQPMFDTVVRGLAERSGRPVVSS